jgi:hypothetical protein
MIVAGLLPRSCLETFSETSCRLVYGVAGLPLGTPVELELIFEVAG